ncbi:MAG TPA: urease accessory protein UreD [Vicinamibacterales bacterium]|nr:urease accessory protein UreD [Vicinamibacterales bacterium]
MRPADRRTSHDVGRRARLELVFECRRGRTVLAHSYAEPPFRVGGPLSDGDGLHLIMASSSPGIFGGDVLEQVIHVGPRARVRLSSQSSLQVHPSFDGGPASLTSRYEVGEDAALTCVWDPLIPFRGSRLDHRIDVGLHSGARLFWSDSLTAGRDGSGERWAFERLDCELRMVRQGSLEYLERYCLEPRVHPLPRPWLAGPAVYFGTTVISGSRLSRETVDGFQAELSRFEGVSGAWDVIEPALAICRLAAVSAPAFHRARQHLDAACRDS